MPILTKQSIMTWTSADAKFTPPELVTERSAFLANMWNSQKTDGISIQIDEFRTQRFWSDQAAAEEWSAWIQATATRLGAGLVSVSISDIAD